MTHYIGFCDFCREARSFTSQEARDGWEDEHRARHNWDEDTIAGAIGGKP